MITNRLGLLTLAAVLLAVAHTLSAAASTAAAAQKPNRGVVRFADSQHIPVRPKVADAVKTKSSSPTKTKKPVTPAQVDYRKKTPVAPAQVGPKKKTPVKSSAAASSSTYKSE